MPLKNELGLKKDFESVEHEAMLNIYYTALLLKKKSALFFSKNGLTDVHFNVLNLLVNQSEEKGGLTQAELSEMLLVNRANITTLIDRMERARLVERTDLPGDRRSYVVKATPHGRKKFLQVEEKYLKEVTLIMKSLDLPEMLNLMALCEKIRERIV